MDRKRGALRGKLDEDKVTRRNMNMVTLLNAHTKGKGNGSVVNLLVERALPAGHRAGCSLGYAARKPWAPSQQPKAVWGTLHGNPGRRPNDRGCRRQRRDSRLSITTYPSNPVMKQIPPHATPCAGGPGSSYPGRGCALCSPYRSRADQHTEPPQTIGKTNEKQNEFIDTGTLPHYQARVGGIVGGLARRGNDQSVVAPHGRLTLA